MTTITVVAGVREGVRRCRRWRVRSDGAVCPQEDQLPHWRGGEGDAGGGGSGPTTPFDLKRTNCCMLSSLLLSWVGRALTHEVLLRASFVVALSVNDGVQSAAVFINREKLARA